MAVSYKVTYVKTRWQDDFAGCAGRSRAFVVSLTCLINPPESPLPLNPLLTDWLFFSGSSCVRICVFVNTIIKSERTARALKLHIDKSSEEKLLPEWLPAYWAASWWMMVKAVGFDCAHVEPQMERLKLDWLCKSCLIINERTH